MKLKRIGIVTIACAALAALPQAQGIGTRMPAVELEGYANTPALLKRSYKSALEQAAKLDAADGGPEILAAIQGLVKSRVDGLRASFERGDYLGAQTAAQSMQKDLAGLPEVEEAAKVLSSIAADKGSQSVIKGQQKLAKIRDAENTKRKEIEAAIESARKVRNEYPGTYVEKEADDLLANLSGLLKKLNNR